MFEIGVARSALVGIMTGLGLRPSPVVDATLERIDLALAGTPTVLGGGDVAQVDQLPVEVAQAYGINVELERVTRGAAMSIPAMRRGRSIIAGTIGTLPLVALREDLGDDGGEVPAPRVTRIRRSLLEQVERGAVRQHTLTWTVDDLLFHGLSWWRVTGRDATGFPAWAERIDRGRIRIDHVRRTVLVDGAPVADRDLIRFDGPDEGILATGAAALRTALRLEAAANRYADMDVPLGLLSDTRTTGADLTEEEVDGVLSRWIKARRKRTVGWLGKSLKYESIQHTAQQLQLVEGRQHAAVEIARLLNLEAASLNAPAATGMTYSNTESIRRARIDALAPYLTAIELRLSMGDVTPRGQRVAFETATYIRGDEAQVITTAATAVRERLVTRDEARARWLDLPPAPELDEQPAPTPGPPAGEEAA